MSLAVYGPDGGLEELEELTIHGFKVKAPLDPVRYTRGSVHGLNRGRSSIEVGKSSVSRRMMLPRWKRELYLYEMRTEANKKKERELAQQTASDAKLLEHLADK